MPSPLAPTILEDQRLVELASRAYREMRADSPHSVSGLVIESITLEVLAQGARWERRRADRRPPRVVKAYLGVTPAALRREYTRRRA